jgi:hypothetical protein
LRCARAAGGHEHHNTKQNVQSFHGHRASDGVGKSPVF